MTLADKARACADAAPLHQSAAVLRECADEIDRLRADLAALRAVVMGLPEYTHHEYCNRPPCDCYADADNAALAAARKLAGLGE